MEYVAFASDMCRLMMEPFLKSNRQKELSQLWLTQRVHTPDLIRWLPWLQHDILQHIYEAAETLEFQFGVSRLAQPTAHANGLHIGPRTKGNTQQACVPKTKDAIPDTAHRLLPRRLHWGLGLLLGRQPIRFSYVCAGLGSGARRTPLLSCYAL